MYLRKTVCLFGLAASDQLSHVENLNVKTPRIRVPTRKSRPHDPAVRSDGLFGIPGKERTSWARLRS